MNFTKELRIAVIELELVCCKLDGLNKDITGSRPHDNPAEYKTTEEFENAWNTHYGFIEQHQNVAHDFDDAVRKVEEALRNVEMPMFQM